jgi:hypothetical protein
VRHDETLLVSGRTAYVDRRNGEVQVYLRVDGVDIVIHAFGAALAARPLTTNEISDVVQALIR